MQPGKKICYIIDAAYSDALVKFAENSDLLICESTFGDDLKQEAREYGHMTASDAATIAKKAKVKNLVLTHFSQRYKDVNVLLEEAKKVFKNSIVAEDLMSVEV
jgi:ribonuclease Z